jgi:rod shape determining protein RodA
MMIRVDRRLLQNVDWSLLVTAAVLVGLSATTLLNLNPGRAGSTVAVRQVAWFGIGLVALMLVASVDYRRFVQLSPALYVLGLGGLIAVFASRALAGGSGSARSACSRRRSSRSRSC